MKNEIFSVFTGWIVQSEFLQPGDVNVVWILIKLSCVNAYKSWCLVWPQNETWRCTSENTGEQKCKGTRRGWMRNNYNTQAWNNSRARLMLRWSKLLGNECSAVCICPVIGKSVSNVWTKKLTNCDKSKPAEIQNRKQFAG